MKVNRAPFIKLNRLLIQCYRVLANPNVYPTGMAKEIAFFWTIIFSFSSFSVPASRPRGPAKAAKDVLASMSPAVWWIAGLVRKNFSYHWESQGPTPSQCHTPNQDIRPY